MTTEKTTTKKRTGRPPVEDSRVRFSCKLPPDLDAAVRRELTERQIARERPEGVNRPLDAGDLVADALSLYFERRGPKR
jgi:hypothetical protein